MTTRARAKGATPVLHQRAATNGEKGVKRARDASASNRSDSHEFLFLQPNLSQGGITVITVQRAYGRTVALIDFNKMPDESPCAAISRGESLVSESEIQLRVAPQWFTCDGKSALPSHLLISLQLYFQLTMQERRVAVDRFTSEWPTFKPSDLEPCGKCFWANTMVGVKNESKKFRYGDKAPAFAKTCSTANEGVISARVSRKLPLFLSDCYHPRSDKCAAERQADPKRTMKAWSVELLNKGLRLANETGPGVKFPPPPGSIFLYGFFDGFYKGIVIKVDTHPEYPECNVIAEFEENAGAPRTSLRVRLELENALQVSGYELHPDVTSVHGEWIQILPVLQVPKPLSGTGNEFPKGEEAYRRDRTSEIKVEGRYWACPFVDTALFNIRGLSVCGEGTSGKRQKRVDSAIWSLARRHGVIMLSETNIRDSDLPSVAHKWGKTHRTYASCGSNGRQGVLTLVDRSLSDNDFSCEKIEIDYIKEPWLIGHLVIIALTHKATAERVLYINLYVKSAKPATQERQCKSLSVIVERVKTEFAGKTMIIGGGDLNNEPEIPSIFNTEWQTFMDANWAFELQLPVDDGVKAWTFRSKRGDLSSYKQLDRVLVGGPDAGIIGELYAEPVMRLADMAVSAAAVSDHRAISVCFLRLQEGPKQKRHEVNYQSHAWIYKNDAFIKDVTTKFGCIAKEAVQKGLTPMALNGLMKSAIKDAAREAVIKVKRRIPTSLTKIRALDAFILAGVRGDLGLAKKLAAGLGSPTIAEWVERSGELARAVAYARSILNSLVGQLDREECSDAIGGEPGSGIPERDPVGDPSEDPIGAFQQLRDSDAEQRGVSKFRSGIKDLIKVVRTRVCEVEDRKGNRLSTPSEVGRAVQDSWADLFSFSRSAESEVSSIYLKALYRDQVSGISWKSLKKPILSPDELTIGDVQSVIMQIKDKAAGPDGVPAIAYRLFCASWSPVLLEIVRQLADPNELPVADATSFNLGTLICIPKKSDSIKIDDLRGITIGNYDNRIVSAVIKNAIQPAFEDPEIIREYQYAFLSERLMTDAIFTVLSRFYLALQQGFKVHILQIDFAKAYDNVSRLFLFEVLKVWGLPEEYLRAIRRLHEHVRSFVWCAPELSINVNRSIKQGDPLACLLVLPVVQVLCDAVERSSCDVQIVAFADDLTFILKGRCDKRLAQIVELIEDFGNSGSDFTVNHSKTTLISSMAMDEGELKAFEECGWRIPRVNSSKILGIVFGCFITEQDVWNPLVTKIKSRAVAFTSNNRLTPTKRMIYANVYLVPIILFAAQFYPIPDWVVAEVENTVAVLVLPKIKSIPRQFMYVGARFGGPPVKLRDFVAEGKAAILRALMSPYFACQYKKAVDSVGGDIRVIEWHPMHPICSLAYIAHCHFDVFTDLVKKLVSNKERSIIKECLCQKKLAKLFTNVTDRESVGEEIMRRKVGKWEERVGGPVSTKGDVNYNTLWDRLEALGRSKNLSRARWITTVLMCNGLATAKRFADVQSGMKRETEKVCKLAYKGDSTREDFLECKMCGAPCDGVTHIFGECPTTGYGVILISEWLVKARLARGRSKWGDKAGHRKSFADVGSPEESVDRECKVLDFWDHILVGDLKGFEPEEVVIVNEVIWDVRCFYTFQGEVSCRTVIAEAMVRLFKEKWASCQGVLREGKFKKRKVRGGNGGKCLYVKDGSERTQGTTSGFFYANTSTEFLNGKRNLGSGKPYSIGGNNSSIVEASNVYPLRVESLKISASVSVWPLGS